jgi:hypothetical protein
MITKISDLTREREREREIIAQAAGGNNDFADNAENAGYFDCQSGSSRNEP